MKPLYIGSKSIGFAVPLLSLRTGKGPCGEFPDIVALADLARLWKMDLVQILPVNDTGSQTSPYSALSAFALNPIHLRLGDLPEAKVATLPASLKGQIAALASGFCNEARVEYRAILSRKLGILSSIWTLVSSEGGSPFLCGIEDWADSQPWVRPYACFVELKRRNAGLPWWEWAELTDPKGSDIDELWNREDFASGAKFWTWIQMRASEQFSDACSGAKARGVDILGDIPILMNADSADVWQRRGIFETGLSAGAPPDMYATLGQNWGFPLYRWETLEKEGYSFWKERLASAEAYYSLYRIDHVLGFFRIWAMSKSERDGFLGRFEPEYTISYPELDSIGFDSLRVRWLSKPHLPGWAIEEALSCLPDKASRSLIARLFERIGEEDLFLFASWVQGGADIAKFVEQTVSAVSPHDLPWEGIQTCVEALLAWWRNRTFLEFDPGRFVATWEYESTQAWISLSDQEKGAISALVGRKKAESLALWEKAGRRILSILSDCVDMRPCAEDLGAVPPCVPAVLNELAIPGLRVLRWFRDWDKNGSPYVPFSEYPENSVACTSVHDSTTLRQWWVEEADRNALWAFIKEAFTVGPEAGRAKKIQDFPLLLPEKVPQELDPSSVLVLLAAFATVRSRFVIYPLQDILAASGAYREANPAEERINVPGTSNERNWLYRVKPRVEDLLADRDFASLAATLKAWRT